MRRVRAVVVFSMLAVMFFIASVDAFEIRVLGTGTISAQAEGAGTLLIIHGHLRDELQRGVEQREVELRIFAVSSPDAEPVDFKTVTTGRRGQFEWARELPEGDYRVSAFFRSTEHLRGAQWEQEVSIRPATFQLHVSGPRVVVGRQSPVILVGRVRTELTGARGTVGVYVNGARTHQMTLDSSGRGQVDIREALTLGENDIDLIFAGSGHRPEVRERWQIRFSEEPQLTLVLEERLQRLARGYSAVGMASDQAGPIAGLRGVVQFVRARDQRVVARANVESDGRGRFEGFMERYHVAPDEAYFATVELRPTVGPPLEAVSETFSRRPTPGSGFLNLLAIFGGLGALLFFGAQSYQVVRQKLIARRAKLAREEEKKRVLAAREEIVPVSLEVVDGIVEASELGLSGRVYDLWREQWLAGVRLRITRGEELVIELVSSQGGAFAWEGSPGTYELQAHMPGYLQGEMRFTLPHHGELSPFRLDLVAVPLKIRRLFQVVVEDWHREDLWGRKTPREIEASFMRLLSSDGLALDNRERGELRRKIADALVHGEELASEVLVTALSTLVEETYFSGRTYDESVWHEVREIVLELRSRRPE